QERRICDDSDGFFRRTDFELDIHSNSLSRGQSNAVMYSPFEVWGIDRQTIRSRLERQEAIASIDSGCGRQHHSATQFGCDNPCTRDWLPRGIRNDAGKLGLTDLRVEEQHYFKKNPHHCSIKHSQPSLL